MHSAATCLVPGLRVSRLAAATTSCQLHALTPVGPPEHALQQQPSLHAGRVDAQPGSQLLLAGCLSCCTHVGVLCHLVQRRPRVPSPLHPCQASIRADPQSGCRQALQPGRVRDLEAWRAQSDGDTHVRDGTLLCGLLPSRDRMLGQGKAVCKRRAGCLTERSTAAVHTHLMQSLSKQIADIRHT